MGDRKVRVMAVLICVTLLLTGVDVGLGGLVDQVRASSGGPEDGCGRPLYHPDGAPWNHQTPCPVSNGVDPMDADGGGGPGARFESPYVAYSTGGSWVEAVSMDDLDRDGKLDMALSTSDYSDPSRDQRLWVVRQSNPLSFSLVYSAPVGASDPESLDVADMDGDGYLDVVVANADGGASGTGDVEIFWATGTFTFTRTDHPAGDTPYAVTTMPVYDHTGTTGYTSTLAVVTNWNDTILSTYLGGTGHTVTRTNYPAPEAGWNQLATGDLNDDGDQDVAAMWGQLYAVPAFTEYFGDGEGNLSVGPDFSKDDQNPSAVGAGDVTNDGRDDVIIARGGNDAEILIYAQGPGGELSHTATYAAYDCPESLDVADVNCDGISDLVATNAGWEAFSWWPGQPDGTLGPYQIEPHSFYFSHIGPNGAEMADVNGDGLKDYVVVDYNADGVLVALQKPCLTNKLYLPLVTRSAT